MAAEEWFQSPSLRDGLDQMRKGKARHSAKNHNDEYVRIDLEGAHVPAINMASL
jgi:hypothetical protein